MKPDIKLLAEIAERHLGIGTLDTRNSDSLDFHEVSVWGVKDALLDAYHAGQKAVATDLAPGEWSYEYSPYTCRSGDEDDGREIPAYEVFDAEGDSILDTNENSPAEKQAAVARLAAAAPDLLEALDYLLAQTVDQDLKYGITLSEGEEEARANALAAIAKARAA